MSSTIQIVNQIRTRVRGVINTRSSGAAPAKAAAERQGGASSKRGCSSCGTRISLDPEEEEARLQKRVKAMRMQRMNYRRMGLCNIEVARQR